MASSLDELDSQWHGGTEGTTRTRANVPRDKKTHTLLIGDSSECGAHHHEGLQGPVVAMITVYDANIIHHLAEVVHGQFEERTNGHTIMISTKSTLKSKSSSMICSHPLCHSREQGERGNGSFACSHKETPT
eukprot:6230454-Amphidinium_carterae.1